MFSKKANKIDKIFTVVLTSTTYCQIESEDFIDFCGLLRKHELYLVKNVELNSSLIISKLSIKFQNMCLIYKASYLKGQ